MCKNIPHSLKKFIRKEKAQIRREFSEKQKRKELIDDLYKKYLIKKTRNED